MSFFLRLPSEIIEQVAGSLDANGFGTLRLMCREINSKTLHLFRHPLSYAPANSLRNLVDISKDSEFGPAIQTVEIFIDHLVDTSDIGNDTDEYWEAFYDQTELCRAGLHAAYLTMAFSNLKGCLAIRISDAEQPWGAASMERELGISLTRQRKLRESIVFLRRVFQVVFGAIMASGLNLKSFDIALGFASDPIRPDVAAFAKHCLEQFIQQVSFCLTSITTLHLIFDATPEPESTRQRWASDLMRFLMLFPAIRYLELKLFVNGEGEASSCSLISEALCLPHLETLSLSGNYSEGDIYMLAMNHKATLTKISGVKIKG